MRPHLSLDSENISLQMITGAQKPSLCTIPELWQLRGNDGEYPRWQELSLQHHRGHEPRGVKRSSWITAIIFQGVSMAKATHTSGRDT